MRTENLAGQWRVDLGDGQLHEATFPGSLDENRIGYRDDGLNQWKGAEDGSLAQTGAGVIATRFTRHHTFEGCARISREIEIKRSAGERVFLEVERARHLRLLIGEREFFPRQPTSISTPYVFELTDLPDGCHTCTFLSDNSYPGWPRDAIVFSSAATDETQTNWNGLLGYLRLRYEPAQFISSVRVYHRGQAVNLRVELSLAGGFTGQLRVQSPALIKEHIIPVDLKAGEHEVSKDRLELVADVHRWNEGEGYLYDLNVTLEKLESSATAELSGLVAEKTVRFGVRDFITDARGRLALNGRAIFVRSEANCAVFPKTGHTPMTKEEWLEVLGVFESYGVNLMRFHSHCPPEAAFAAADEMGMLMQPELSHWDAETAFESDESYAYYTAEMEQILKMLANHPSFVMFSWGNELCCGELGMARMCELLARARTIDPTRLYANASNGFYGAKGCDPASDFYTSQKFGTADLRGSFAAFTGANPPGIQGFINQTYPHTTETYDEGMRRLRETYDKAVFSFEVGQYEVLPDFAELERYDGVTDPANYRLIRDKIVAAGFIEEWPRYVRASGELSLLAYRAEVEAALRTRDLSGMSLLGLQDFPGQGTALVGMINALLEPKPYDFAKPERFRAFFRAELPLLLWDKFTYESGEHLTAKLQFANFGKEAIEGSAVYQLLRRRANGGDEVVLEGSFAKRQYEAGQLHDIAELEINLPLLDKAERLELQISIGDHMNEYPMWIYPGLAPDKPESVYETRTLDDKAIEVLAAGGTVYLSPPSTKEALPRSIQAQFTTDFWSVGTFPAQEGGMGQLIDNRHPALADFPTETHSNWQWWPMAKQRALILPRQIESIVTEMDSYAYLRPMTKLFECRCGDGKLLVSTFGLQDLQVYPEARALLASLYRYMASAAFAPEQTLDVQWIQELFQATDD